MLLMLLLYYYALTLPLPLALLPLLLVLVLLILVITRKCGNCDALQLEATRRRASRSGLFWPDLY